MAEKEEITPELAERAHEARLQLQKKLEDDQTRIAKEIAIIIHSELLDLLESSRRQNGSLSYNESSVSAEKVLEAVRYALRDFDRLELDQKKEFSISKYVGYLGF